MTENEKTGLVKAVPTPMHGPIEVQMLVYVRTADGQIGKLTIGFPYGVIPTQDDLKEALAVLGMTGEGLPAGSRLLTKPEFVKHITRKAGQEMTMPGNQDWEDF